MEMHFEADTNGMSAGPMGTIVMSTVIESLRHRVWGGWEVETGKERDGDGEGWHRKKKSWGM